MDVAFEVWDAEVVDPGLAVPTKFVRQAEAGTYHTALRGPTGGTVDDWTPADKGRLVLIKIDGVTAASFPL